MDIWKTHKCIPSQGRMVDIHGRPFRHCQCELCGRDFVEDDESGEQYAVDVSVFTFRRLVKEVSDRWLNEPCPNKPVPTDGGDRKMWDAV
jgi:hypothetical protein